MSAAQGARKKEKLEVLDELLEHDVTGRVKSLDLTVDQRIQLSIAISLKEIAQYFFDRGGV